jgi:hypothetical protein
MNPLEKDNEPRFRPALSPFYEVYFLKFHLLEEGIAFWIRYTLHAPRKEPPYGSLWAFAFDGREGTSPQGAVERHPWESVRIGTPGFHLQIGEAEISSGSLKGKIERDSFSLSWDLRFTSEDPSLRLFPYDWMYTAPLPKTKYLSPAPAALFSGRIRYQGKEYRVERAPGEQAHIWGREHAVRWAWAHCNTFVEDPAAVFEGLSAQVPVGPLMLPPLSVFYIRFGGREYFFNRPRSWLKGRSRYDLNTWSIDLVEGSDRFIGRIENDPASMIGVRYTDPDHSHRFCHHTEWAVMELEHYRLKDDRWQQVATLRSRAVSYEVVASRIDPLVPLKVLG